VKYGVLAAVVVPAVAGGQANVFQYVEPFGTVFFLSPSAILWSIAISILVASAIIPRFYCRYLCPLGAALALASILSPFRIGRVRHCTMCTVCEHDCPTGAIQREQIDFKECVRCNRCEVNLRQQAGVCRHDLGKVTQLVQLRGGLHRHGASVAKTPIDSSLARTSISRPANSAVPGYRRLNPES
jgi:Pyruvate/2-oxoacid:ferredoxin oxidoreductase delta subunit